jgi:hypothetical protein
MPILLALVLGIILFVVLLKLVIGLLALAIGLAFAVIVYFAAEKLVGKGR